MSNFKRQVERAKDKAAFKIKGTNVSKPSSKLHGKARQDTQRVRIGNFYVKTQKNYYRDEKDPKHVTHVYGKLRKITYRPVALDPAGNLLAPLANYHLGRLLGVA